MQDKPTPSGQKAAYSKDYLSQIRRNAPKPVLSAFDNGVLASEIVSLNEIQALYLGTGEQIKHPVLPLYRIVWLSLKQAYLKLL